MDYLKDFLRRGGKIIRCPAAHAAPSSGTLSPEDMLAHANRAVEVEERRKAEYVKRMRGGPIPR